MQAPLVKERITEELRQQIIQMRCDEIIKIDSERILAEKLNVSRPSIRAAIKSLITEGLLIQEQGKGTYITPKVKTHTLNIICSPDIKKNDPFYNNFLIEITNTAAKESIHLFVLDLEQIKNTHPEAPLLMVGRFEEAILDKLTSMYRTVIAFQSYPHRDDFTQIYFDHYKIGYMAAKILNEYGHENVMHLAGPEKYASSLTRKSGFIDGTKYYGMKPSVLTGKMNWSGGYAAADEFVQEFAGKDRPSAVFVANDWMAVGFIQKLKEQGIKIPQDISIIGCDNIPLASEISPFLTTFSLDMKLLIGELFSVFNQIGYEDYNQGKKILISPQIIHRDSLIRNR
jgi:DNA-binding LacI/PurR family transcriptional regulator